MLGDFDGTIRQGLREKLACVLFQLPERLAYTEERLEKIINSLDNSFTNVVEFRHESWWQETVYDELSRHSISFCSQSHPKLPSAVVHNTPIIYYRFHGVPHLYKSQYPKKTIESVIDQVTQAGPTIKAYVYFNNTMGIAGIRNARQAEKMVGGDIGLTLDINHKTIVWLSGGLVAPVFITNTGKKYFIPKAWLKKSGLNFTVSTTIRLS